MEGPHSVGTGERMSGIAGGRGGLTCVEWAVSDLELCFIFIGNVFPCGQEHLSVCRGRGGGERWDPNKLWSQHHMSGNGSGLQRAT